MSGARPRLSVAIPFYDEEDNVLPLFDELLPVLEATGQGFEVVAVDDGSRDATAARLAEARSRDGRVRVIRLARNTGQSAAYHAAFRAARGELVVTMDGDLQIDPRDIPEMVRRLEEEGVDLVYGWRRERRDGFVKRVSTRIANGVRNRLTGERIHDTGCPLKVFRAHVLAEVPPFTGMHRFYVTLAHMNGHRSCEMVVRHRPRRSGRSKYGVWNRVFRALRDCLVVRWMIRRRFHYEAGELPPGGDAVMLALDLGSPDTWFKAVGWVGQGCFFSRFLVQWLASERSRRIVVPAVFWWLSLLGAACGFTYALWQRNPIILLSYTVNVFVYGRNLVLERTGRGLSSGILLPLFLGLCAFTALVWTRKLEVDDPPLWLAVGAAGQACWVSRFPLQWFVSERLGRATLPRSFFWVSFVGSVLLLAYAIQTGDPIWIAGFALGPFLYSRSLVLAYRPPPSAEGATS